MLVQEGWANLGMSQYRHLADISVEDGYSEVISPGKVDQGRSMMQSAMTDSMNVCMYV